VASSIDHHDYFFPRERHRIAPAWVFIELRTPGEGPRGHEGLHYAAVIELVPDGVCMIWAGFLDERLEVVRRRPHLTLVAMRYSRHASRAGAARLPVVAVIMVGRGCGLLRALLAPLFAVLDALLSMVDDDVGWCLLVATRGHLPASLGWVKHDHFVVGGVRGGDAAWLPDCVPERVTMLALEWAPCTMLRQCARAPLASLIAGLGVTPTFCE
jgi:hypothetical protein